MKGLFHLLNLTILFVACGKDGSPDINTNGMMRLDAIGFQLDDAVYEITDPPSISINIVDNSFSFSEGGHTLIGNWSVNQSLTELYIKNPNGTEIVFPLMSFSDDKWIFIVQKIDLTKKDFTAQEDQTLNMVNRALIKIGKDIDSEMTINTALKIYFILSKSS